MSILQYTIILDSICGVHLNVHKVYFTGYDSCNTKKNHCNLNYFRTIVRQSHGFGDIASRLTGNSTRESLGIFNWLSHFRMRKY